MQVVALAAVLLVALAPEASALVTVTGAATRKMHHGTSH